MHMRVHVTGLRTALDAVGGAEELVVLKDDVVGAKGVEL